MSYEVKQGNIFGRIGSGIGQGLAEQLPKEIDRNRLASGLKQFEQESANLTPMQVVARAAAIPGSTPQLIQTLGELAKQQNIRNAFGKGRRGTEDLPPKNQEQDIRNVQFANLPQDQIARTGSPQSSQAPNVSPQEMGQPQIVDRNPLRQEAIPKASWTKEQRNDEIGRIFAEFPNLTFPEAQAMAADNEARDLAQPLGEQAIDTYLQEKQKLATDKFTKQLETKLQKKGENVFADISGEMLNNLQRGMERELRTNPKASVDDVVNNWTNKALDLAKTNSQLDKLAKSSFFATPILLNKEEYRNKLKTYQKDFADAGNTEEFFNKLKADFMMSPQGAAYLAYPRNKNLRSYLDKVKINKLHEPQKYSYNARKQAADIENLITSNDSLLAIAMDLRTKDPFFDQNSFFNQLREDMDNMSLTKRQTRELEVGTSSMLPSWGDLLILPAFRGL